MTHDMTVYLMIFDVETILEKQMTENGRLNKQVAGNCQGSDPTGHWCDTLCNGS